MSRGLWNTAAQFVERGYAAKALDISTSLFYPREEEQQHHFRVSSRMMPMPPGYTKVFGFAPTWCTTNTSHEVAGYFFIACFCLRELPFVHH